MAEWIRQEKKRQLKTAAISFSNLLSLLFAEGHAVSTLIHGRIALVGADHDPVQGAVVLGVAVVSTGLDGAFDALVCMTVHR